MNEYEAGETLRLELFTRATSAAPERRQRICDWIDRLVDGGFISGVTHHRWPATVNVGSHDRVVAWYRRFLDWAERAGASIEPPFHIRREQSAFTGGERDVLVTPELCLAAYVGDALVGVRPCHRNGAIETIEGFLSDLERASLSNVAVDVS